MGNAFGPKKTLKEIIREQKRMVDRSIRQLDREKTQLERQEKKLISDIKISAKKNQMGAVKIMAKDLVRIRRSQIKFTNLVAQLRGMSLQMTEMASTQALAQSMAHATRSMIALNAQMNLPGLQKVMREFQMQAEKMEMKQEMIGDAIDDALEDEADEEEEEQIVSSVLDEIGINLDESLVNAPTKQKEPVEEEVAGADKELEDRLANLRR
jgi:charged multivesicular body protein 2A